MGKNYNEDKFLYLISAELFKKYRHYPEFISIEEDDAIIENKKRIFRNSINNYSSIYNYYLSLK